MSINKAKDDTITNLQHSADDVQDGFNKVVTEAKHQARKIYNSANDHFTDASYRFTDASDKVKSQIRSNPVRSSTIALGAGLLIGLIFRPGR